MVFHNGQIYFLYLMYAFSRESTTKTKDLDSREVTSLAKLCQHVIKMITENTLLFGLVCDFEWLTLSYNDGQNYIAICSNA